MKESFSLKTYFNKWALASALERKIAGKFSFPVNLMDFSISSVVPLVSLMRLFGQLRGSDWNLIVEYR
jgi:hypothetical protein